MKKRVNHCLVQHGIYLSSLVSFPAPFLPSPLLIFLQTKHAIRFFQSKQVDGFINKSQANQKTKKKKGFQILTNPGSSGLEMVQERKTLP